MKTLKIVRKNALEIQFHSKKLTLQILPSTSRIPKWLNSHSINILFLITLVCCLIYSATSLLSLILWLSFIVQYMMLLVMLITKSTYRERGTTLLVISFPTKHTSFSFGSYQCKNSENKLLLALTLHMPLKCDCDILCLCYIKCLQRL